MSLTIAVRVYLAVQRNHSKVYLVAVVNSYGKRLEVYHTNKPRVFLFRFFRFEDVFRVVLALQVIPKSIYILINTEYYNRLV